MRGGCLYISIRALSLYTNYSHLPFAVGEGEFLLGEALLIKYGGAGEHNPLDDIAISADYCSILAVVRDSGGNKLPNIPINCKDGGRWYNYTTNENGMSLFKCNSGSANIRTMNSSSIESYVMIDQKAPDVMNIDAVVGTKMMVNITFEKINGRRQISGRNFRFMDTSEVKLIQMLGGGGGSSPRCGGGGGAYNEGRNISIDRNTRYDFLNGRGGSNSSSGGTTTALGLSAVGGTGGSLSNGGIGGGSGSWKGGDGGGQYQNGGISAYANSSFNYGGGGAGIPNFIYGQVYWSSYPVYKYNKYDNTYNLIYGATSIITQTYAFNGGANIEFSRMRISRNNYAYNNGSAYVFLSSSGYFNAYNVYSDSIGDYGSGGGATWSSSDRAFDWGRGGNGVIFIEI